MLRSGWELGLARFRLAWESVRSSYWFLPSLMGVASAGAAIGMLALDRRVGTRWLAGLGWLYSGDASGARDVLSTVAGSMITVAGVIFSIIMVVLPLATQQYGPRLIRNFLRDPGTEVVLGTFIGTFIFCMIVLRAIRGEGSGDEFVPHLSVTAGVGTGLLSIAVLIYFIQHVAASIRVENVVRFATRDIAHTLAEVFPARIGHDAGAVTPSGERGATLRPEDGEPYLVTADRPGYIEHLDGTGLVALATEHDLVVELIRRPGDYLAVGEPVARIWRAGDAALELADRVRERLFIGRQRTPLHDVVFAVERLTEIAARALSPAVNDPYTAVNCIDELSAALVHYAAAEPPAAYRYDAAGALRLIAVPVTFAEALRAAFAPLRLYGRDQPLVVEALLRALARIGRCSGRADVQVALRESADAIAQQIETAALIDVDRGRLRALYEGTVSALAA